MKHVSYFLISPVPALVEQLKNPGTEGLADLCNPVMWSGSEHDRGVLSHADVELLTKLLFLDVLHRERCSDPAFPTVFTGLSSSGGYFDSLWTIERVRIDMSIEDAIADAVETGSVHALIENGNDLIKGVLLAFAGRET